MKKTTTIFGLYDSNGELVRALDRIQQNVVCNGGKNNAKHGRLYALVRLLGLHKLVIQKGRTIRVLRTNQSYLSGWLAISAQVVE
jgi:hypothetical protein